MSILLLVICVPLGVAAYFVFGKLWVLLIGRLTENQRARSYRIAKDFPAIVIGAAFSLVFFAALGATVVYYAAIPIANSTLREATEWGPGVVFSMLMLLVVGFWTAPDLPTEISPPRGRTLRQPRGTSPPQRGRTIRKIRTFRED